MTNYRKMKAFLIKRIRKTSIRRFWLYTVLQMVLFSYYINILLSWLYNSRGVVFADPDFNARLADSNTGTLTFISFSVFLLFIFIQGIWALINYWFPSTHKVFNTLGEAEGEILNNLYKFHAEFNDAGFGKASIFSIVGGINKVAEVLKSHAEGEEAKEESESKFPDSIREWRLYITPSFVFYNGYFRLKLASREDIVCAYKQKTINNSFLTRWATLKKDLIIGFLSGDEWNLNFKRRNSASDNIINFLKEKMPYILTHNDDKKIKKHWEEQKDEVIYNVAKRYERYIDGEEMEDEEEPKKEKKEVSISLYKAKQNDKTQNKKENINEFTE